MGTTFSQKSIGSPGIRCFTSIMNPMPGPASSWSASSWSAISCGRAHERRPAAQHGLAAQLAEIVEGELGLGAEGEELET